MSDLLGTMGNFSHGTSGKILCWVTLNLNSLTLTFLQSLQTGEWLCCQVIAPVISLEVAFLGPLETGL